MTATGQVTCSLILVSQFDEHQLPVSMETTPQLKRFSTIVFGLAVVMLAATIGILIAFGPSTVNVVNIFVAGCNVVVFSSLRRRSSGPTG